MRIYQIFAQGFESLIKLVKAVLEVEKKIKNQWKHWIKVFLFHVRLYEIGANLMVSFDFWHKNRSLAELELLSNLDSENNVN